MEIPGEQPYQAGVGDEAIHIDIITFNLDDNPDFEAISYSWGDPILVESITGLGHSSTITVADSLNNQCNLADSRDKSVRIPSYFRISANLFCVLRHVRLSH